MVENMCGLGDSPIEIANEALQPHGLCLRPGQGGWRQRLCPSPMAEEEIQEQQQQLCDVGSHSASLTRQVAMTLRRNPQVRLWSEDQRNRVETRTVRHVMRDLGLLVMRWGDTAQAMMKRPMRWKKDPGRC